MIRSSPIEAQPINHLQLLYFLKQVPSHENAPTPD